MHWEEQNLDIPHADAGRRIQLYAGCSWVPPCDQGLVEGRRQTRAREDKERLGKHTRVIARKPMKYTLPPTNETRQGTDTV